MILICCGDGALPTFCLVISTWNKRWFWEVVMMVIGLFLLGDLVIIPLTSDLIQEQKGAKNCHFFSRNFHLGTKNMWWFEAFCLVIGHLRLLTSINQVTLSLEIEILHCQYGYIYTKHTNAILTVQTEWKSRPFEGIIHLNIVWFDAFIICCQGAEKGSKYCQ